MCRYLYFPKSFGQISRFLPNKSAGDCVHYYYASKKTVNYKRIYRHYWAAQRKLLRAQQRTQESTSGSTVGPHSAPAAAAASSTATTTATMCTTAPVAPGVATSAPAVVAPEALALLQTIEAPGGLGCVDKVQEQRYMATSSIDSLIEPHTHSNERVDAVDVDAKQRLARRQERREQRRRERQEQRKCGLDDVMSSSSSSDDDDDDDIPSPVKPIQPMGPAIDVPGIFDAMDECK